MNIAICDDVQKEAELLEKMDRWEYLEEIAQQIE